MEEILHDILLGKNLQKNISISYHIGNEFRGETILKLSIDGSYVLQSNVTSKRKPLNLEGNINTSEVRKIVQILFDSKIWNTKHTKKNPADDEALTTIEVSADEQKYQVSLFESEVAEIPSYNITQKALLQLIKKISSNQILEQG